MYFADYRGGFIEIKKQIRECKAVISARMHCAINAVCENVPTIFISYSQKSIGMCKYVYGDEKWAIEIREVENKLLPKIEEMLKERDEISQFLKSSNKRINEDYMKLFK